jgi:hypothetical protein
VLPYDSVTPQLIIVFDARDVVQLIVAEFFVIFEADRPLTAGAWPMVMLLEFELN